MYQKKDLMRVFGVKSKSMMDSILKTFEHDFPKPTKDQSSQHLLAARLWNESDIDEIAKRYRELRVNGESASTVLRKVFGKTARPSGGAAAALKRQDAIAQQLAAIQLDLNKVLDIQLDILKHLTRSS